MSPVETWCHNINYYIPDEGNETKNLSMEQMARIRKLIYTYTKNFVKNSSEQGVRIDRTNFEKKDRYSNVFEVWTSAQ